MKGKTLKLLEENTMIVMVGAVGKDLLGPKMLTRMERWVNYTILEVNNFCYSKETNTGGFLITPRQLCKVNWPC